MITFNNGYLPLIIIVAVLVPVMVPVLVPAVHWTIVSQNETGTKTGHKEGTNNCSKVEIGRYHPSLPSFIDQTSLGMLFTLLK